MTPQARRRTFASDFVWGFAAAAPQIEGAAFEDGKGASVWDTFSRQPGKVHDGDNLDVACDHYHRYPEDLALMAALGARHYRLSIAWPRIFPTGHGQPSAAGIAFYNRLIDKALELGLTPWVTMFHWDLPQALEDEFGGWRGRGTVDAFALYADTLVKAFGDRVKHWITLNEIICFTTHGYGEGSKAPGLKLPAQVVNQTYHNALLAHGQAVRAVRQFGGPGARVGLTDCSEAMIPVVECAADIEAACQAFVAENTRVLEPLFKGRYHPDYLQQAGADAPEVQAGDLALISQPTDFLGLNIYRGRFVRAAADGRPEILPFPPNYPRADASWLTHTPQSIYWCTRMLADLYGVQSIYITENGAGYNDEPPVNGEVLDLHRRDYLRNYLRELQRAIDDGAPVHGYFLWSFMDNFEWADGYARRFGVVYTDYATQQRTPKLSAHWYSEVMRANAIL
ncbi:MAG: beta-glucosidase [Chitinophagaceae bacterium]|nr:beta-glucosidase [Rubrivivax sp.]